MKKVRDQTTTSGCIRSSAYTQSGYDQCLRPHHLPLSLSL